jgi:hypothetical protein
MSVSDLCLSAFNSDANSAREAFLVAVVVASALCGLLSSAFLIKKHVRLPTVCILTPKLLFTRKSCVEVRWHGGAGAGAGGGGGANERGATPSLNIRLVHRYLWFMASASFSGAITWYAALQKQQADVTADGMSSDCPSQLLVFALSESWYMIYFIFKPISLLTGTLALVIPLLRLFDISNVATGSIKRKITRVSRVIVALVCACCFALSLISCWYQRPPLKTAPHLRIKHPRV